MQRSKRERERVVGALELVNNERGSLFPIETGERSANESRLVYFSQFFSQPTTRRRNDRAPRGERIKLPRLARSWNHWEYIGAWIIRSGSIFSRPWKRKRGNGSRRNRAARVINDIADNVFMNYGSLTLEGRGMSIERGREKSAEEEEEETEAERKGERLVGSRETN